MQIGLWSLECEHSPMVWEWGDNRTAKNTIFTDC